MTDYGQAYGILFDDEKHTYRDFGLICTSLQIELPELKRANRVKVSTRITYRDNSGSPWLNNRLDP